MTIREAVRKVLDDVSGPVAPEQVAEQVVAGLSDADLREALSQVLPMFVREVIVTSRATLAASGSQPRSWKRQAIREAWRRELSARYATPEGYKALRDFSHDDLVALAQTCREMADRNAASAVRFGRLAECVSTAGVERLGDLPESVLASELGWAA